MWPPRRKLFVALSTRTCKSLDSVYFAGATDPNPEKALTHVSFYITETSAQIYTVARPPFLTDHCAHFHEMTACAKADAMLTT